MTQAKSSKKSSKKSSTNSTNPSNSFNSWIGLLPFFINITLIMIILMVSSPALPYITNDYGLTAAQVPWQNTLYTMSAAILAPLMGWVGDTKGLKKQMISGILIFVAGNVLCALSPNFVLFCIGRFLTGFGTAAVVPATMNYIVNYLPKTKHVTAFAIMGACMALGSGVGPSIAGFLLTIMTWQSMFLYSSFAMLLGLILVFIGVPSATPNPSPNPAPNTSPNPTPNASPDPTPNATKQKLDGFGMITLFIGMGALLSLLTLSSQLGWGSPIVLGLLALTIIMLVLFYRHETKADSKLIDVSLLRSRHFMVPSMLQFIQVGITGYLATAIAYYFSVGRGLPATYSGLWMSLFFIITFPFSFLVGKLNKKISSQALVFFAVLLWAAAIAIFSFTTPTTPLALLFIAAALPGIANAFIPGICNAVALQVIPPEQSGAASGTIQMLMNLGSPVIMAIVIPYLSLIGSSEGVPNYLVSFPIVSRYMFVVIALALLLVILFPKDAPTEAAST